MLLTGSLSQCRKANIPIQWTLNKLVECVWKDSAIDNTECRTILHARITLLFDIKETYGKRKKLKIILCLDGYVWQSQCLRNYWTMYPQYSHQKHAFGSIGQYRDDGLAMLKSTSGSQSKRSRRHLIITFRENGQNRTTETKIKSALFADIKMNLWTISEILIISIYT